MMREVTLDTNCLIDLEQGTPNGVFIRGLMADHASGKIRLRVPAIAASEIQPGGGTLQSFNAFKARIHRAGLRGAILLEPPMYLDMCYIGFFIIGGQADVDLESRIHNVLHPAIEFDYVDYCAARGLTPDAAPADRRWRNAKCDVLVVWSHIHYGGHVLVTADEEFHKEHKRAALVGLGAGVIVRPKDARAVVACASGPTSA